MNRASRKNYPQFTSDWGRLGYFDAPQTPNLAASINPIFRKRYGNLQLFKGTDEEYEMIEPAVRLASAYLYSPKSCAFLYSLVYADRKVLPNTLNKYGSANREGFKTDEGVCTEFRVLGHSKVSAPRMRRLWREVACHNTWGFEDQHHFATTCTEYGSSGADLRADGKKGQSTFISLNSKYLKRIKKLRSNGQTQSLVMLNVQFSLAIILCHEMAHVVHIASDFDHRLRVIRAMIADQPIPEAPPEPFFEDHITAELGMAWESHVMGGKVLCPPLEMPWDFPTISSWPDGVDYFDDNDWTCPQRGVFTGPKETYVVNFRYIQRVFQQSFWDDFWASLAGQEDKGSTLRIPRTVGHPNEAYRATSQEEFDRYWAKRRQRLVWGQQQASVLDVEENSSGKDEIRDIALKDYEKAQELAQIVGFV